MSVSAAAHDERHRSGGRQGALSASIISTPLVPQRTRCRLPSTAPRSCDICRSLRRHHRSQIASRRNCSVQVPATITSARLFEASSTTMAAALRLALAMRAAWVTTWFRPERRRWPRHDRHGGFQMLSRAWLRSRISQTLKAHERRRLESGFAPHQRICQPDRGVDACAERCAGSPWCRSVSAEISDSRDRAED